MIKRLVKPNKGIVNEGAKSPYPALLVQIAKLIYLLRMSTVIVAENDSVHIANLSSEFHYRIFLALAGLDLDRFLVRLAHKSEKGNSQIQTQFQI
jgi:hypothetical protein